MEPRGVKRRAYILTLSMLAAFFIVTSSCVQAAPALWVVQSPTAKIYLFGTVHILRAGVRWRSPQLDAAIHDSQDLYLEIANPGNVGGALSSIVSTGFDRDHPLSTKLSKADLALLDAAAKRYGFGGEKAFEPMQPWFVALTLGLRPQTNSAYSAGNGVDVQIRSDFVAAGKPVLGLETFEQQAHIFADLPMPAQIALLESELRAMSGPKPVNSADALVTAWTSGDEDRLATLLQADGSAAGAAFYQVVFTNRNREFANALAQRLKGDGTSFVAVGAGHLAGPGGVPALLASMGYTVTRIPTTDAPISDTPTATPAPTPRATPIPQTLTPPQGWKLQTVPFASKGMKVDRVWADPKSDAIILAGHLDIPGISATDLDSFEAIFHQGLLSAANGNGSVSSERVKICGGRQNGIYNTLTIATLKEDVVVGVSDRAYLAQYVRRNNDRDDPAAAAALLSLCPP